MPHSEQFAPNSFSYQAFVSYARADRDLVDRVFKRLAAFRTPSPLMRNQGEYGPPPKSLRIFLDRKSAQLGAMVPDRLQGAISSSAFLIIFCSATSRSSEWVNREIELFLEFAEPHRLLPVFVNRAPGQPLEELMPPALAALGEQTPIGADLVLDGGDVPVSQKLIGAMIGFSQDQVAREQEKADRRRRLLERTALMTISTLSLAAAVLGWSAANEARKAEVSLIAALDSLDTTTPFVHSVLSQGRVTVSDVEPYLERLQRLFGELNALDLKQLPDIRYSYGQALTSFSHLQNARGDAVGRAESAHRAFEVLQDFEFDPGPTAQIVICDAALSAGPALGAVGRFQDAHEALDVCVRVAETETNWAEGSPDTLFPLMERRSRALAVGASLFGSQGRFAEALTGHERATAAARELVQFDNFESRGLELDVQSAHAATLELMGRHRDSRELFDRALQGYAELTPDEFALEAQRGAIRALAFYDDEQEAALAMLERLLPQLESLAEQDPARRDLLGEIAALEVLRGRVHAHRSVGNGNDPAIPALEAFSRAESIYSQLLDFDDGNPHWRRGEALRLGALGDFYFRLSEERSQSSACRNSCATLAAEALQRAIELMKAEPIQDPFLRYARADFSLRHARARRLSGELDSAEALVDEAEVLYRQFRELTEPAPSARILGASLTDERADLAAASEQFDDALAQYQDALAIYDSVLQEQPQWVGLLRDVIWTYLQIARTYERMGDAVAQRRALRLLCARIPEGARQRSRLLDRDIEAARNEANSLGISCR